MNNILISDPFLFPPSGEDLLSALYLPENFWNFTRSQFEEAWEEVSESNLEDSDIFPEVASPAISSVSTEICETDIFEMDLPWLNEASTFEDFFNRQADSPNPGESTDTVPLSPSETVPVQALFPPLEELEGQDFIEQVFGKKEVDELCRDNSSAPYFSDIKSMINTLMSAETLNLDSLLPLTNLPMDLNAEKNNRIPETEANFHNVIQDSNDSSSSVVNIESPSIRVRSRRKAPPGNRVASASPLILREEEDSLLDIKPDLVLMKGSSTRRKRKITATESLAFESTEPSSMMTQKKKRKYEFEDPQDPSVKNAIAAKLNRDRKKKEMEELKARVTAAEQKQEEMEKSHALKEKEYQQTIKDQTEMLKKMQDLYSREKEKNIVSNGLVGQLTNVKQILECILPPLNQTFGPMNVMIPQSFEEIPVRLDHQGHIIKNEINSILPTEDEPSSSFTSFHISPQDREIRVDYDPHLF